jgi:DNA-binding transcriptional regulator YhcF (GntR family)
MELSINPNTIQRAYTELERRGVIYSLGGRGSFVSASPEGLLQAKRERLLAQLTAQARAGLELGLTPEELLESCRAATRVTPPSAAPPLKPPRRGRQNSNKGSDEHD